MGDVDSVPTQGIQGISDDDAHGVELGAANDLEPAAGSTYHVHAPEHRHN